MLTLNVYVPIAWESRPINVHSIAKLKKFLQNMKVETLRWHVLLKKYKSGYQSCYAGMLLVPCKQHILLATFLDTEKLWLKSGDIEMKTHKI